MHILAILGAIITILILVRRLDESGIDLGWLNPFLWARRRRWRQKYHANPLFGITDPRDLAALLAVATARRDGDLSSDEKTGLLELFGREFNVPAKTASGLLTSSCYLLGDSQAFLDNPQGVMKPALETMTNEQRHATVHLLEQAAELGGGASELQRELVAELTARLAPQPAESTWSPA